MRLASAAFPALVGLGVLCCAHAGAQSIRFVGNADNDVDRVTIEVGNGQPANIGAADFTIEFWLRAGTGNNQTLPRCNDTGYNWTTGNILLDRDRTPPNYRDFGLAIMAGRVVFGIEPTAGNSYTMCSTANVRDDGDWHHVAIQRRRSDGFLWMYVDGQLDQQVNGPDGDVSYPAGVGGPPESLLVIGAEKFDFDTSQFPGFRGWIDELRLSNRLQYSANFAPSTAPFNCTSGDGTVALYHFDEGSGNAVGDDCGQSNATRLFGGSPQGPEWSTETPISTTPSPGQVRFSSGTYAANEGTASRVITVRRVNGSVGAASVEVIVSGGTATANADYQFPSMVASWSDGQSQDRPFTITIVDDTAVEADETINLALSNVTGASPGNPSSAVVTIADNDSPPTNAGTLQFTSATFTVAETAATLDVTVSRSGGSMGAATVEVDVNGGTATLGSDFQVSSTPLSWASGQQGNRTFAITLTNDALVEGSETIELVLGNETGATLGTQTGASVTVTDDDQPSPPPPPPPPPPPNPPTASGGGGGGKIGWLLLVAVLYTAVLRRRCRVPLHPH